jgi:transcription termination/antitermination protein NusA
LASIYQSIEILSKEKGIDLEVLTDAVKDAMVVAARKHYRTEGDLVAEFDEKGAIQIYDVRQVVELVEDADRQMTVGEAMRHDSSAAVGSELRIPMKTDSLGRISAQTAKQVILQKVREAERETVFAEFVDRVGDLVNCTVKQLEGPDLVVEIGRTEARLPKKEQSRAESFSVSDRVRCVIRGVEKAGKNAGVTVSRAAPELVMRLFEQEVPEIYDGTVTIKGCAREAGERTKIAVSSNDRDVDSVGACVGMKGMRVQSIIRELRGEKIDIIQFSEDPVVFATNALSPAKITRVAIVDGEERHMEVIVDDSQLSLAIGKKGQNVRLAAKLLGWHIDIKSEEEKRQEVETEMASLVVPGAPVSVLLDHGLSELLVGKLTEAGIPTVEQLGGMTPEQLEEIPDVDDSGVQEIQSAVVTYYSQFEVAVEEGEAAAGAETKTAEEPAEAAEAPPETAVADEPDTQLPGEPLPPSAVEDLDDSVTLEETLSAVGDDADIPVELAGTTPRETEEESTDPAPAGEVASESEAIESDRIEGADHTA